MKTTDIKCLVKFPFITTWKASFNKVTDNTFEVTETKNEFPLYAKQSEYSYF